MLGTLLSRLTSDIGVTVKEMQETHNEQIKQLKHTIHIQQEIINEYEKIIDLLVKNKDA